MIKIRPSNNCLTKFDIETIFDQNSSFKCLIKIHLNDFCSIFAKKFNFHQNLTKGCFLIKFYHSNQLIKFWHTNDFWSKFDTQIIFDKIVGTENIFVLMKICKIEIKINFWSKSVFQIFLDQNAFSCQNLTYELMLIKFRHSNFCFDKNSSSTLFLNKIRHSNLFASKFVFQRNSGQKPTFKLILFQSISTLKLFLTKIRKINLFWPKFDLNFLIRIRF